MRGIHLLFYFGLASLRCLAQGERSSPDIESQIEALKSSENNLTKAIDELNRSLPQAPWQSTLTNLTVFAHTVHAIAGASLNLAADLKVPGADRIEAGSSAAEGAVDIIYSNSGLKKAAGLADIGEFAGDLKENAELRKQKIARGELRTIRELTSSDKKRVEEELKVVRKYVRSRQAALDLERASKGLGLLSDALDVGSEIDDELKKKPEDRSLAHVITSLIKVAGDIGEILKTTWALPAKLSADVAKASNEAHDAAEEREENIKEDAQRSRSAPTIIATLEKDRAAVKAKRESLEHQRELQDSPTLIGRLMAPVAFKYEMRDGVLISVPTVRTWQVLAQMLPAAADRLSSDVLVWLVANAAQYSGDLAAASNDFSKFGSAGGAASCQRWIEKVISAGGETPATFLLLGDALVRGGKYQEALAAFTRGLALYPSDTNLLNARASLNALLNRPDEAKNDFHRAFPSFYVECGGRDQRPCAPAVRFACRDGTAPPCTCGGGHPCPPSAQLPPPPCPPWICGGPAASVIKSGPACPDGSVPPCREESGNIADGSSKCPDGSRPPCRGGVYMGYTIAEPQDLNFSAPAGASPTRDETRGEGLTKPTLIYSNLIFRR